MDELRKVEVLKDGSWEEIDFIDLEFGNTFRMFDAPDEPVISPDGATAWVVVKGPYRRSKDGVLTVDTVLESEFENYLKVEGNNG